MSQLIQKMKSRWFSAEPFNGSSNSELAKLYFILALVFGTLIIYLSPFFTPPDENTHFLNVCRISSLHIFPDVENDVYGSYITEEEENFFNTYNGIFNGLNAEKITYSDMYFQSALDFKGDTIVFHPGGNSNINPVGYTASGLGAWITKYIFHDFSPFNEMIVGKLFNLFFSALMIYFAIKRTPILPKTMFLLSLMPMTIYQCASLSYDALLIGSCFLLFSYVTHLIVSSDNVVRSDVIAIAISSFFIFGIKSAYIPLLLCLFAIEKCKFGSAKRYIKCITIVILTGIAGYLIPSVIIGGLTGGCVNSAVDDLIIQQKQFVSNNPFYLVNVFFNTINQSFRFWGISFFGNLGSLDTNFWRPFEMIYYIILLITGISEICIINKLNIKFRTFSLIAVVAMSFGTIVSMYISWTPLVTGEVGGVISTGTQGRYFIPIAIFAISVLGNGLFKRFRYADRIDAIELTAVKATSICYLLLTVVVMLIRFWI